MKMKHRLPIVVLSLPVVLLANIASAAGNKFWWEFPSPSIIAVPTILTKELLGPSIIGHPAFQDEGRGLFLRNLGYRQERNSIAAARRNKSPIVGYIDLHGQTREIALGLIKKEAGGFQKSTGQSPSAAGIFATIWSWMSKGPSVDSRLNYFTWGGLSEMVNNTDSWQGSEADFIDAGIKQPTYPSGVNAKGYSGAVAPQNSNFYDALGGKNIFGKLAIQFQPFEGDEKGLATFESGKEKFNTGHIRIAKDTVSRWWLEYNINVAKSFLSRDVNGFWIDHASGLFSIGLNPVSTAFGNWSVDTFNQFLSARTDWKGNTKNKITDYVLEGAKKIDPSFKAEARDVNATAFKSPRWLKDPYWLAYISYKSILASQRASEIYTAIKNEARLAGKDQETILVGASDLPVFPFAVARGLEADQVHTRYSHLMSPELGTLGRGLPMRGSNGPFYNLSGGMTNSPWSHVWYILPTQMQLDSEARTNLAPTLAAEALANNALLAGDDDHKRFALTSQEGVHLNEVLTKLAPVFQGRNRLARVAILYSANTLYSNLTPGGFAGANEEMAPKLETEPSVLHHGMAVQGWAELLESMHIPYRIIPDFKVSLKSLSGIQLLIIPHVVSMEKEMIQKTIKPFLLRVSSVLVTGTQLGELRTVDNLFASQPNLMGELKSGESTERLIVLPGNPGADFHYFLMKDQKDRLTTLRNAMAKPLETLMADHIPLRLLRLPTKLEQTTRVVTHTRRGEKEYFFDLYNIDVNETTMEATPNDGGKVTIELPGSVPEKIVARWYSEGKNAFINLSSSRDKEGKVVIQIPGFRHYGSIHISGIL